VNSSKSQIQTCVVLHVDDRTSKHSAKGLRIDAQRTTDNIPAGGVKKLLFSCVSLLLSATEE
jgi:small ligand-binding sensory domain FIST